MEKNITISGLTLTIGIVKLFKDYYVLLTPSFIEFPDRDKHIDIDIDEADIVYVNANKALETQISILLEDADHQLKTFEAAYESDHKKLLCENLDENNTIFLFNLKPLILLWELFYLSKKYSLRLKILKKSKKPKRSQ